MPQGLGLAHLIIVWKLDISHILFVGRFKGSIISRGIRGEPMRRKKKNKSQNVPSPTLPPLPAMPLPPNAGGPPMPNMPLPPLQPAPGTLPPAPMPAPQPLPVTPQVTPPIPAPMPAPIAAPAPAEVSEESNEYGELWAKRSAKPLPQIYGAIDRLGSGEAGSLLDRYSDRFGHSLDRDIIVLRKKEREEALNEIRSEPVVELLDTEEPDRLTEVEEELRSLKPQYEAAKAAQNKDTLKLLVPQLESLMRERKELKGIPSTPKPKRAKVEQTPEPEAILEESVEDELDDADELFTQFFTIVNDLLGDELPEKAIEAFMSSESFELFKEVGANPAAIDDERRGEFFKIIDEQLGNMPDESISTFVESGDFALYKQISEMYA